MLLNKYIYIIIVIIQNFIRGMKAKINSDNIPKERIIWSQELNGKIPFFKKQNFFYKNINIFKKIIE